MADLFNTIVQLFNSICQVTGVPYHELNILIYVFLIPSTWWLIVWLRSRRLSGLGLLHIAIPMFHYAQSSQPSRRFYDANVAALFHLGGNNYDGYIKISIVAGLILPVLIYLALLLCPKRWLVQIYFLLLVGNMAWYVWVLTCF